MKLLAWTLSFTVATAVAVPDPVVQVPDPVVQDSSNAAPTVAPPKSCKESARFDSCVKFTYGPGKHCHDAQSW